MEMEPKIIKKLIGITTGLVVMDITSTYLNFMLQGENVSTKTSPF
jgi:hypothetical protein